MPTRDELLPQVLRHLRESKRMTIDMVASYLEVKPDDIKQYEAGEKKLRPALFIGLAALFKIPINVFELKKPEGNNILHYRRTIGYKELGEYSYTLYGYMINIVKIYETGNISIFSIPCDENITSFKKSNILRITKKLRKLLGFSETEPIQNLQKKLDTLEIEVIYTELPKGINGLSYTIEQENSSINSIIFFISNNDNLFKQSFSIAHEFGHIMMHNTATNTNTNLKLEEIANYFANVFLLPPESIKNKVNNKLNDYSIAEIKKYMEPNSWLYDMCNEYYVSVKTLLWSLYHSKIINKKLLKTLCDYYDKLPQYKKLSQEQGRKDCEAYNKKMLEALQKKLISQYEYDCATGFIN